MERFVKNFKAKNYSLKNVLIILWEFFGQRKGMNESRAQA